MPVLTCPTCRVANPDDQPLCHCCGSVLPVTLREAVRTGASNAVQQHYCIVQQEHESKIAGRALLGAAFILFTRGTIYPLLLNQLPVAMRQGLDPDSVRMLSYIGAAAMFAFYMLARTKPLIAAIAAIVLYVGICAPDLMNGEGLLGKGIISKAIMAGPLARALIAGLMHWLHEPGRQAIPVKPAPSPAK